MIDAFASYPHYVDHIRPVWDELSEPGSFYVGPLARKHGNVTRALGPGPPVIVAGFPDLRRTRHRDHIFIEHGVGENWGGYDPHYSGGPGRDSVILFLCPNERVAEANRSRYPVPSAVVGSPHTESLSQIQRQPRGDKLRVVVSFHWDCRTWANTTTALPHYEPDFGSWAADSRIEIMAHAHPRIIDRAEKSFARAGIQTLREFRDVIAWADVYAVDNSSTLFEAAACGLDVVMLDAPWYQPDHDSLRFGRFADMAPRISNGVDLVEAALTSAQRETGYDEMVTEIFGTLQGSATRAAQAIEAVIHEHPRTQGRAPSTTQRTDPAQPSLFGSG